LNSKNQTGNQRGRKCKQTTKPCCARIAKCHSGCQISRGSKSTSIRNAEAFGWTEAKWRRQKNAAPLKCPIHPCPKIGTILAKMIEITVVMAARTLGIMVDMAVVESPGFMNFLIEAGVGFRQRDARLHSSAVKVNGN
tara:strand:+ start:148 stop:561 length:414 start_codon:yes stop_codon:yes gene_type:complete